MRIHHPEPVPDSYRLDDALWTKGRNLLAGVAAAGWAASALAFAADRARFTESYLVAFAFWITIALGALFFVMLQHLTGAAWSVTARRIAENVMATIPAGAVLFLPVACGLPYLYGWARPDAVARDPILQGKQAYLNPQAFWIRAGVYFILWSLWALKLYHNSVAQDESSSIARMRAAARWSAPGMILLIVTLSLASFDWLMSLDPHWYSTMFGVYVGAGGALAAFALITLVLLVLRRSGVLVQSVNREHYHDLGKWLFGLTVFWMYIAFCQYLLIWYANLPEETVWYRDRLAGSWSGMAALIVLGHFFLPFFVLMPRAAKRNLAVVAAMCVWILAMHYVDLYWVAMPVFSKQGPAFHWADAAALTAAGGTFALVFWARLRRRAIVPAGDLRLQQALEFTNV